MPTKSLRRTRQIIVLFAFGSLVSGACVREIAVGTRPTEDDASDGGTHDGGPPLVCEQTDCEVSVQSAPVCDDYEQLACLAEKGGCEWKCVVKPLIAGETRCGSEVCTPEQFCDAPIGTCGESGDARCIARPDGCTRELAPVCGCNGVTYDNACEAQRDGAAIVRAGVCAAPAISPCQTECEPLPPVAISTGKCPDGELKPSICADRGNGTCSWVQRKCEPTPICTQPPLVEEAGACWTDADCTDSGTCEGATVCPCDAECLDADKPGVCT